MENTAENMHVDIGTKRVKQYLGVVFVMVRITLERFSNECRKTKTKVITPANHNRHKLSNEPIRTRSKYMLLASSAGKNVRARARRD